MISYSVCMHQTYEIFQRTLVETQFHPSDRTYKLTHRAVKGLYRSTVDRKYIDMTTPLMRINNVELFEALLLVGLP